MNTENFDEGDTQVAPPGEFKAVGCGKVAMRVYSTGEYIAIKCGEMFSGKLRLCEKCKLLERGDNK